MADMFDAAERSEIMSKVHSQDTTPEIHVRKLLYSMGYRFRLHRSDLPGKPDIVLPKYKTVIFVHGCFWHGCPTCRHAQVRPKNNSEYWERKLNRTLERDHQNVTALEAMEWHVLIIWECEARKRNLLELKQKLSSFISST